MNRSVHVFNISALFCLTISGCSPCGGEIRLSRNPYRASIQPAPIMLDGPGSASVPFRIEPPSTIESVPAAPATTTTGGESPQPRWK